MSYLLALLLLLQAGPASPRAARSEVRDAVGDAEPTVAKASSPDLVFASVEVSAARGLLLKVRFTEKTFRPESTYIQFSLDFGQSSRVQSDSCDACGNYLVNVNCFDGQSTEAQVQRLAVDSRYEAAGTVPIIKAPNGVDIALPWAALPKGVNGLTYRVVTGIKLGGNALSVILDQLPDKAVAAGVLKWR